MDLRPALPDPSWPIHPPRRWFSIQNSQLVYQKKLKVRAGPLPTWAPGWAEDSDANDGPRGQGTESLGSRAVSEAEQRVGGRAGAEGEAVVCCLQDALTVVVDDLRLCSVKPCEDTERRFCFEVVSPAK